MITKVAIYLRVSRKDQIAENQLLQLKAYAEKNNWAIYSIYEDVISGKETSRPAFDKLFIDAHKNLFDIVLFWDLSRFSRAGTTHTLLKLKELENLDIKWHSYNEAYVSTTGQFKDVVISVIASIAQAEREKISDRTKAGLDRARKQGKLLGKPCKKLSAYDKKLILDEYEKQKSINRTAKIFKGRFSYGFLYEFLKNEKNTLSKKGSTEF